METNEEMRRARIAAQTSLGDETATTGGHSEVEEKEEASALYWAGDEGSNIYIYVCTLME